LTYEVAKETPIFPFSPNTSSHNGAGNTSLSGELYDLIFDLRKANEGFSPKLIWQKGALCEIVRLILQFACSGTAFFIEEALIQAPISVKENVPEFMEQSEPKIVESVMPQR